MSLMVTKQVTLAQAKKITNDLRETYGEMKGRWFALGRRVDKALKAGVPHALGLNVRDWISQWATDEEQGESTILGYVRIVRVFESLPEKTITQIPTENLKVLATLPESSRLDQKWVQKAKNTPKRQFSKMVEEERTGRKAKPKQENEQEFRTLHVERLPKETVDQFKAFFERMATIARCGEDKPNAPVMLTGAFLSMVEDSELRSFYEGVSDRLESEKAMA